MEKMPYYAITVRRYNILFRHTEWFHQTQDLYNEILLFYYQLYLETFPDEQPGTQEALRILEKLTIVGRDKQPVPNPIPWFLFIFEGQPSILPRQQPKAIWQGRSRNSPPRLLPNQ